MAGIIRASRHYSHRAGAATLAFIRHLLYRRRPADRVNFDLGAGPETFLRQALDGVRAKLAECRSGQLPGFGKPTGVVVNYSPIMRSTTTSKVTSLRS